MVPSTVYCDNCGAANRAQARFCIACGQVMPTASSLPPTVQVGPTSGPVSSTGLLASHSLLKQRYRILNRLGQGGMGAVYKAQDTQLGDRLVAVKEMSQKGLDPQEIVEAADAFKHEALMLAGLRHHPNLPSIYNHFDDGGRWYLVMDFIEGETLEKQMGKAGGKLPVGEVLEIGIQLATMLGYLHQHQPPIIFRDLKPANVMRTADADLFLIDFGIARHFKPGQAKDTVAYGTEGYAAPEQHGKAQTTPQSDIYSLGAMLHHLLSGSDPARTPFLFASLSTAVAPAELGTLIMRMVAIDATQRPASMDEVKRQLQGIATQRMVGPTVQTATPTVVKPLPSPPLATPTALIVSQQGEGHYTSISEAIKNAKPQTHILVRPGTYSEGLVLDKQVEIIGAGPREKIVLESYDTNCILMQTDSASVRGLTLRCWAGLKNKKNFGVDIPEGWLTLVDCDITSDSLACVAIHNATANPVIQRCKIHDGKSAGVLVYENGRGTLEDCDIFGNAFSGLQIREGGDPVIRRCKIHDGKSAGVLVYENGRGTLEDCDIFGNAFSGVQIREGSTPVIRRCKIHDSKEAGVLVHGNGQGTLEDCDIFGNAFSGVQIKEGSTPVIRRCKIHDGKQDGVFVYENGRGTLKDCDIFANAHAGVHTKAGGDPVILRCRINRNTYYAVYVHDKGRGTIVNCDLTGNASGAWDIGFGRNVRRSGNKE